jgi:outer membrane protein assembly factor BamA
LGRTTASAVYQQGILDSSFVLRGYPYGALIGKSLYSGNLEYRFPIRDSFEGYNLRPLFFQKYYGAVFLDAATVDGFYYANAANNYYRADAGRYFMGSGLELKADTTLFYQLPVTFTLGLYYGFDAVASYGFTPFIGFLL